MDSGSYIKGKKDKEKKKYDFINKIYMFYERYCFYLDNETHLSVCVCFIMLIKTRPCRHFFMNS